MKHAIKGLLAVAVLGGLMAFGWTHYKEFLTKGMRPTAGTQKLNQMEKEGVPDFTLDSIDGRKINLKDFSDRVVIVSFWASWCEPCVQEFPSMVKLVDYFKGKVVLLGVSADFTMEDLNSFLKPYEKTMPKDLIVMWDKGQKTASLYGTEVLPESYIMAPGLKLVRKISGSEDWYSAGAIDLFNSLITQ